MMAAMAEDKGLRYKAVLIEVENKIKNLEDIGLNMQKVRNDVEEVKEELEAKNNNNTKNNIKTRNTILPESYNEAIIKIEKIIKELDANRKDYYIIAKKINSLKNKLEKIDKIDVMGLLTETSILLDSIEYSSTIDYGEEEKIVEAIYEVVYNVLKIASIYDVEGAVSLFHKVENSKTHSAFISCLVKEEIALCDDPLILEKQIELEANSFDINALIDKELFSLLAISSSDKYIANLRDKLKTLFNEYKDEMEKISNNIKTLKEKRNNYNDYKYDAKNDLKGVIKRGSVIGAFLIMLGIGTIETFKMVEKDTRTYYTKTTTYEGEDITYDEGYESKSLENVKVIETLPWEKTILNNYIKTYNYYTFSSEEDTIDPEDYINLTYNLKPSEHTTEKVKELPEDFDSNETHYKVEFKEYSDVYKRGNIVESIIIATMVFALISSIPVFVMEESGFLNSFSDDIIAYKNHKKRQKYKKEEIKEYTKKIQELFNNAKGLLATIRNYPGYKLIAEDIEEYIEDFAQREEIQSILKDNLDYSDTLGGKSL